MKEKLRQVNDVRSEYDEYADEIFTLNIGCPHCGKSLSLSLAKLELSKIKEQKQ